MNSVVMEEFQSIEKRNEYVFYNPKTGSFVRDVKESFWRACRKAKIKNLTVHDLRHTAASRLVNYCGISIVEAAGILGHSKIEMTMKYVHPTEQNKRRGMEQLGNLFITRHQSRHLPSFTPSPPKKSPHVNCYLN